MPSNKQIQQRTVPSPPVGPVGIVNLDPAALVETPTLSYSTTCTYLKEFFPTLQNHSLSDGLQDEVKAAVDPFCYIVCSHEFGDTQCLADCIERKFNSGKCLQQAPSKNLICCCSP
ncbi:hypothetical protein PanWU01x14_037200 [Parasponia andersonii]|uniref:Defensin-like domain-containing protein n=1 Tax=Parasponia andersonii TaxID=3476 RepID=A0A2P5DSQ1_PARAD|nr:hypothetical protein PanWU01x14_037200 [Parasponia andersonii]